MGVRCVNKHGGMSTNKPVVVTVESVSQARLDSGKFNTL